MTQTMLPRNDANQLMMFEGKTVILLDSESGTYREWLIGVNHTQYCIVQDGDTWTLLYDVPDVGGWCEAPDDVETFLTTHRLILSA